MSLESFQKNRLILNVTVSSVNTKFKSNENLKHFIMHEVFTELSEFLLTIYK